MVSGALLAALGLAGLLTGAPSFAEPSLSPDGSEIVFASGGDLWTVPAAGGAARLIVSHPATESRPFFSPDGARLAFMSTRAGSPDIWVLTLATGELQRLTWEDGSEQLDGWSRDGRWIYYSSTSRDIAGMSDVYRIPSTGGTPQPVTTGRYTSEFFGAPSPDGRAVAFSARGNGLGQWWRRGGSHLDQSEIWLRREDGAARYERLVEGSARSLWPMWGPDGRTLYFVSDRGGAPNLWARSGQGEPRALTTFTDGRVLWPAIAGNGSAIVFERGFRVWRLDLASGRAAEVPITLRGAAAGPAPEHLSLSTGFSDLALSPDGKKVAFVARGDVFVASARDGGDAVRLTRTPAAERTPVWLSDSRRLVYAADRDGATRLYLHDVVARAEQPLTRGSEPDAAPAVSPDGSRVAFLRGRAGVWVVDVATGTERELAQGRFDLPPLAGTRRLAWSPDGSWLGFLTPDDRRFTGAVVVPAAGGAARPVSFLANGFAGPLVWGPDGTFLLFGTAQRTEAGQVARVDLVPRLPRFREDQFRDLFPSMPGRPAPAPAPQAPAEAARDSTPRAAGRATAITFDDIRRRLTLLPTGLDVTDLQVSPDGKTLLLTANAEGQENLYLFPLDDTSREPAVARQLTSTPGGKGDAQFSPDGKEVFYLDQGRISVVPVESRQPRTLAVTAEVDVDFADDRATLFDQAWTWLRDHFYDPAFHGADWDRVRAQYAPQAAGARTADELRRILALMAGELDASHLGVNPPPAPGATYTGRLGLRFDRAAYDQGGQLRIAEVIPLGPAALAGGISAGQYLRSVDGTPIEAGTNLDQLLAHRIGRRVELGVSDRPDAPARTVAVRPVNTQTEKALLYRAWVEQQRAYVERASDGRLGYVHMFDMSANALAQLYVDLDAANQGREGVVIDVRNNNGGFVNAYAIDVLARRSYLTMTQRGFPSAPARAILGQRALERPTVLVTNQHSLSDAEDFTEGYRALKLGKVVGEPTSGWIIYTWNQPLLDGTVLRLPRMRVDGVDGKNMERNPRPVDVPVTRPIGEDELGRDSQLDAAIRVLLGR